jgi:hypothetical protein
MRCTRALMSACLMLLPLIGTTLAADPIQSAKSFVRLTLVSSRALSPGGCPNDQDHLE